MEGSTTDASEPVIMTLAVGDRDGIRLVDFQRTADGVEIGEEVVWSIEEIANVRFEGPDTLAFVCGVDLCRRPLGGGDTEPLASVTGEGYDAVIAFDTSPAGRILGVPTRDGQTVWGEMLLFDGGRTTVVELDVELPEWADEDHVVVASRDVELLPVDGSGTGRVLAELDAQMPEDSSLSRPAVSPDGTRIAVTYAYTVPDQGRASRLYLITTGSEATIVDDALGRTAPSQAQYGQKSFSADGRLVAVVDHDIVRVVDFDAGIPLATVRGSSADFQPE